MKINKERLVAFTDAIIASHGYPGHCSMPDLWDHAGYP